MNRIVELSGAVIGATAGGLTGAPAWLAGGAVAGFFLASAGAKRVRENNGISIWITAEQRKDMESSMHLAMAASWALRPVIEADRFRQKDIVQEIFDRMVEAYTVDITPHIQEMNSHLLRVVKSGIFPEDSLEHMKRRYAPRFLRKDATVCELVVRHILSIQARYGNIIESRAWFIRWCHQIGLEKNADHMWESYFQNEPEITMAKWLHENKAAAMASYLSEEE